jgi:hypothetical protein
MLSKLEVQALDEILDISKKARAEKLFKDLKKETNVKFGQRLEIPLFKKVMELEKKYGRNNIRVQIRKNSKKGFDIVIFILPLRMWIVLEAKHWRNNYYVSPEAIQENILDKTPIAEVDGRETEINSNDIVAKCVILAGRNLPDHIKTILAKNGFYLIQDDNIFENDELSTNNERFLERVFIRLCDMIDHLFKIHARVIRKSLSSINSSLLTANRTSVHSVRKVQSQLLLPFTGIRPLSILSFIFKPPSVPADWSSFLSKYRSFLSHHLRQFHHLS